MPTFKQKQAMRNLVENGGTSSVGGAMRRAGYSPATAKTPTKLTRSKGWAELTEQYLPDELLAKVHRELFDYKEWRARDAALDKAYKIKNRYKDDYVQKNELEKLTDEELQQELNESLGEMIQFLLQDPKFRKELLAESQGS